MYIIICTVNFHNPFRSIRFNFLCVLLLKPIKPNYYQKKKKTNFQKKNIKSKASKQTKQEPENFNPATLNY